MTRMRKGRKGKVVESERQKSHDSHQPISQDKCLIPFQVWNQNGAPTIVLADNLAHRGRDEMSEMMDDESKWSPASGAAT